MAPKPKLPSDDAIAAYERGGVGHDTRNHSLPTVIQPEQPMADVPPEKEKTKRLSVDLARSLHRRFKTVCSRYDTTMIDEVVGFIERRTAELEARNE